MHLGNFLQIVTNARGSLHGIEQIYLIGDATGRIGDPSGKRTERVALDESVADINAKEMRDRLDLVLKNLYSYLEQKHQSIFFIFLF